MKAWSVQYKPCFDEWHPKSMATVYDENGEYVFRPHQNTSHPGDYDEKADKLAHLVVNAVNAYLESNRASSAASVS